MTDEDSGGCSDSRYFFICAVGCICALAYTYVRVDRVPA